MMKTINITFLSVLLLTLCAKIQGQNTTTFFEVKKTGKGESSIIFIPGFASSGEVWDETVPEFEKDYTCYILTMPGFAGVAPQQNPTFNNWVEQITGFIKDNKIEKPLSNTWARGFLFMLSSCHLDSKFIGSMPFIFLFSLNTTICCNYN